MSRKIWSVAIIAILILTGCTSMGINSSGSPEILGADKIKIESKINSNILRVIKTKGGNAEKIEYLKAVSEIEDGKNKICLCQAVGFRVAQLTSQAWSDGIFRCYDIKKIRTGWNTDGVYEFFSDQMFHGEKGDLELSSDIIAVESIEGGEPTPETMLTAKDAWYEIALVNGTKLNFSWSEGKNGVYTSRFLKLRTESKNGNKSVIPEMAKERKKVEANMQRIPFNRITVEI
ncbi:MAG: hypothetical protein JW864_07110 [Spirochaetes bacterium]|nr:hypothetical protein [Spirochaetota bacterium]